MYHFKCVMPHQNDLSEVISYPCTGPYRIMGGYSDAPSTDGLLYYTKAVENIETGDDFLVSADPDAECFSVIYITNSEGKTLDVVRAFELPPPREA